MPRPINLTGNRFGRLVAIRFESVLRGLRLRRVWQCQCDCGGTASVLADSLRRGETKSCGCIVREGIHVTHGHSRRKGDARRHPLYAVWCSMKNRCRNPKAFAFHRYGGRGISVCDRWSNDFQAFLDDMGPRPTPDHSIDRIDNDGNYEPGNCRWATGSEQSLNRLHPKGYGRKLCNGMDAHQIAEITGLHATTIRTRFRHGYRGEKLLIETEAALKMRPPTSLGRKRDDMERGDDGKFLRKKPLHGPAVRRDRGDS